MKVSHIIYLYYRIHSNRRSCTNSRPPLHNQALGTQKLAKLIILVSQMHGSMMSCPIFGVILWWYTVFEVRFQAQTPCLAYAQCATIWMNTVLFFSFFGFEIKWNVVCRRFGFSACIADYTVLEYGLDGTQKKPSPRNGVQNWQQSEIPKF